MRRYLLCAAALGLGLSGQAVWAQHDHSGMAATEDASSTTELISAPGRAEEAIAQDAERHPAEVLDFFAIPAGATVADVYAGQGYWTELLARVVGAGGHVYATEPAILPEERRAPIEAVAARNPNVEAVYGDIRAFDFPDDSLDFAMLSMSYHDVYFVSEQYGMGRLEPSVYLADLYAAMAPGGVVGVIDHVANAGGDTREVVDALHRMDPAVLRSDFEAAGFVFDGESDVLRNPEDDHTVNVFDESIRGQTDKVVYRFRKPEA